MDRQRESRERKLAHLAAAQHCVVAGWQLRELGFSATMIRHRVECARLYRLHRDVFSLLPEVTPAGRVLAAALTYGPHAKLSHRAAAAVHDLGPWPTGVIDVTVANTQRPRPGTRVHVVPSAELEVVDGFPVTTVERTLVDLASVLPLERLRDTFDQAERLGVFDLDAVMRLVPGRRGARKIRTILADALDEPPRTRSELERLFRRLCRKFGIPLPSHNVCVAGEDVDAYWPERGLVVELDSYEFHRTRRSFERDRQKAAALELAGYRVLRFTWRQLTRQDRLVAETILAALGRPWARWT